MTKLKRPLRLRKTSRKADEVDLQPPPRDPPPPKPLGLLVFLCLVAGIWTLCYFSMRAVPLVAAVGICVCTAYVGSSRKVAQSGVQTTRAD